MQGHPAVGETVEGASKPQLTLLTDITGAFRPGVLTCLMGVSGAGKTTLMDVLASRKTGECFASLFTQLVLTVYDDLVSFKTTLVSRSPHYLPHYSPHQC